ncbi:LOW QUALITY PROTEIN: Secreted peptide [Phytophthora megakarya]|uniref:Secreted peptide n=1 Tax=Phytophthora megakarya TaxID=4795 RepID=A0A225WVM9_9STRA|nr:LOW QUALITY PROTEIN: Secreted peptide [Phytophthora megakarya]
MVFYRISVRGTPRNISIGILLFSGFYIHNHGGSTQRYCGCDNHTEAALRRHAWPSVATLTRLTKKIKNYVWNAVFTEVTTGSRAWLDMNVAGLPRSQGGMAIPDLRVELMAMAATSIVAWGVYGTRESHIVGDVLILMGVNAPGRIDEYISMDLRSVIEKLVTVIVLNFPRLLYKRIATEKVRYVATPVDSPLFLTVTSEGPPLLNIVVGDGQGQRCELRSHHDLIQVAAAAAGNALNIHYVHPHPRSHGVLMGGSAALVPTSKAPKAADTGCGLEAWCRIPNASSEAMGGAEHQAISGLEELQWKTIRRITGLGPWGLSYTHFRCTTSLKEGWVALIRLALAYAPWI